MQKTLKKEDLKTSQDFENAMNGLGAQLRQTLTDIRGIKEKSAKRAKIWKIAVRTFMVLSGLLFTYAGGVAGMAFLHSGMYAMAAFSVVAGVVAPFVAHKISNGFDEFFDIPSRKLDYAKSKALRLLQEKSFLMRVHDRGYHNFELSNNILANREHGLALLRQLEAATSVEQVKDLLQAQPNLDAKAKKFLLRIAALNLQNQGDALQAQIETTQNEIAESKRELQSDAKRSKNRAKWLAHEKEQKRAAYLARVTKQR